MEPLAAIWFVQGFLPDPDGINVDITDGEAIYTVLASTASPATVPPDILVATFRFRALGFGAVKLKATAGAFGKTRVLSIVPGTETTGDISQLAGVRTKWGPHPPPGPLVDPNVASATPGDRSSPDSRTDLVSVVAGRSRPGSTRRACE